MKMARKLHPHDMPLRHRNMRTGEIISGVILIFMMVILAASTMHTL